MLRTPHNVQHLATSSSATRLHLASSLLDHSWFNEQKKQPTQHTQPSELIKINRNKCLGCIGCLGCRSLWRHSTTGCYPGSWPEIWVRGTKAFQYFVGCSTWLHFFFFFFFLNISYPLPEYFLNIYGLL